MKYLLHISNKSVILNIRSLYSYMLSYQALANRWGIISHDVSDHAYVHIYMYLIVLLHKCIMPHASWLHSTVAFCLNFLFSL